ncbi:lysophospholipid acyltransferase LPEAT1-like [Zingiber officinale]|uniref:lysophospholipid acyltransferase LPEAT1-like n=1 Tax=Zingiber officinale TaxID=94328 RepID=UPI001C4D1C80|nr:lysophospholipid acyltransferase LPEAT1-like [Zingiber officinale]
MTGWRRAVVVRCGRFASRAMLFTFGFYWIKESHMSLDNEVNEFEKPYAVVSNHISYVDILYHMSLAFPSLLQSSSASLGWSHQDWCNENQCRRKKNIRRRWRRFSDAWIFVDVWMV